MLDFDRARRNRVEVIQYLDKTEFKFSVILLKKFMTKSTLKSIYKLLSFEEPLKSWVLSGIFDTTGIKWCQDINLCRDDSATGESYVLTLNAKPECWNISELGRKVALLMTDYESCGCAGVRSSKRIGSRSSSYEIKFARKSILRSYFDDNELTLLSSDWIWDTRRFYSVINTILINHGFGILVGKVHFHTCDICNSDYIYWESNH
jgi:hypothetical protein